jgi:hypothetical protein
MDNTICYLNTDLDLVCQQDLTELARTFEVSGCSPLHVTLGDDQNWYATFETDEQHVEPELSITQMLTVIESLAEPLHSVWMKCTRREFNIGYDCGDEPWAFNQGLSSDLLRRIAAIGASLRWTLYPDREPQRPSQSAKETGSTTGTEQR